MDTATKRYSAINISCPWRGVLPLPDGNIDAGDRQIVPFLYSGILAGEPAPEPVPEPRPPSPDAGGVGRIYAPTRRRKPERLVFLERELLEQLELRRALEKRQAAQERRVSDGDASIAVLNRTLAQQRDIKENIARLEAAIAHEIEMRQDDDDAMDLILRVLH